MTSSLIDDIASAPEDPGADALFAEPELEDAPQRTKEPEPGKRGPRKRERQCTECGKTFVGGRRVCPDCKGTPVTTTRTQPRGSARLEEELLESLIEVASDIAPVMPTVAGVLVARGEQATHGLVTLAKGKPRTTAILEKIAKGGQSAGLVSFGVMLVIAAMVDLGKISPDSMILDSVGYAEILRDEKGKAQRNERGLLVKERHTLREIREMMTGEDTSRQTPAFHESTWDPVSGVAPGSPNTFPAMNWTP